MTSTSTSTSTSITQDRLMEELHQLRGMVNAALDRFSRFGPGCPPRLERAIRHSLLGGGKRLRPSLVLLSCTACGGSREAAIPAACAVEMVHAYSLIHDDLPAMDDDDLRRGQPSCHRAFDEATAILSGDALLARAFELLAVEISDSALSARCCAALARSAGATALVGGQVDDLAEKVGDESLADLVAIHRRKTGAMLRVSLELGAVVAGATERQTMAVTQYGDKLGLAFQIVDDLLDLAGDEATMGKRTGKDSERGKLTYPGLLGAAASREKAETLVREGCGALSDLGDQAATLIALAQYVLHRDH